MDFWTFVSTDKGRRFIPIPNRFFEFILVKINRIYIIKNGHALEKMCYPYFLYSEMASPTTRIERNVPSTCHAYASVNVFLEEIVRIMVEFGCHRTTFHL